MTKSERWDIGEDTSGDGMENSRKRELGGQEVWGGNKLR